MIKRIALARMDVAFTLIHNGKTVKQFRQAANTQQRQKELGKYVVTVLSTMPLK